MNEGDLPIIIANHDVLDDNTIYFVVRVTKRVSMYAISCVMPSSCTGPNRLLQANMSFP